MANLTVIGRHNTDITTLQCIGQLKVKILKDRLQNITPGPLYILHIITYTQFLSNKTKYFVLRQYGLV